MKKIIAIIIIALVVVIVIGRCAATNRNNQIIMNKKSEKSTSSVGGTITLGDYVYNTDGSIADIVDQENKPIKAKVFMTLFDNYGVVDTVSFDFDNEKEAYDYYEMQIKKQDKVNYEVYITKDCQIAFGTGTDLVFILYKPCKDGEKWTVRSITYNKD